MSAPTVKSSRCLILEDKGAFIEDKELIKAIRWVLQAMYTRTDLARPNIYRKVKIEDGFIWATDAHRIHRLELPKDFKSEDGIYSVILNKSKKIVLSFVDHEEEGDKFPTFNFGSNDSAKQSDFNTRYAFCSSEVALLTGCIINHRFIKQALGNKLFRKIANVSAKMSYNDDTVIFNFTWREFNCSAVVSSASSVRSNV